MGPALLCSTYSYKLHVGSAASNFHRHARYICHGRMCTAGKCVLISRVPLENARLFQRFLHISRRVWTFELRHLRESHALGTESSNGRRSSSNTSHLSRRERERERRGARRGCLLARAPVIRRFLFGRQQYAVSAIYKQVYETARDVHL